MAFDKLIVRGLTGAAKSGIKMNLSIDSLKQRIVNEAVLKVEEQLPIQLPFDPVGVLQGTEPLSPNIVSVEYVNSIPSETLSRVQQLSPTQRTQINNTLDSLEATVNTVIQQKNSLQGSLNTITTPLNTLETLSNTIGGVIGGLKAAVTVIKAIPIPTSVPPGVGIPLNVINGFSAALDNLKNVLDKFGGPLAVIPPSIKQINEILIPISTKLSEFDPIFEKILKIIAFIRLLLKYPDISQADVDQETQSIGTTIQQSLAVSSIDTSNPGLNNLVDQSLLDQLDPNSNNPLYYKGFLLIIEFDPENTLSIPARRIKAENPQGVKLYSEPPDQGAGEVNTSSKYSFSSSTQVLISEVKFNIDQYLIKNPQRLIEKSIPVSPFAIPANSTTSGTAGTAGTSSTNGYLPFGFPGSVSGEVKFRSGKAWRWLGGSQNKWVEHTISFDPFTEKGINGTERFIKTTQNPYPRAYYKWDETLYRWVFQRIVTG